MKRSAPPIGLGLLLNTLLPGAAWGLIGRPWAHLGWALLLFALTWALPVASLIAGALTSGQARFPLSSVHLMAAVVAWAAMQLLWLRARQRAGRASRAGLVLTVLQAVLTVLLLWLVLPTALLDRQRSLPPTPDPETARLNGYMKLVLTSAQVVASSGQSPEGDCSLQEGGETMVPPRPAEVASCRVLVPDLQNISVRLTTQAGRTLEYR